MPAQHPLRYDAGCHNRQMAASHACCSRSRPGSHEHLHPDWRHRTSRGNGANIPGYVAQLLGSDYGSHRRSRHRGTSLPRSHSRRDAATGSCSLACNRRLSIGFQRCTSQPGTRLLRLSARHPARHHLLQDRGHRAHLIAPHTQQRHRCRPTIRRRHRCHRNLTCRMVRKHHPCPNLHGALRSTQHRANDPILEPIQSLQMKKLRMASTDVKTHKGQVNFSKPPPDFC